MMNLPIEDTAPLIAFDPEIHHAVGLDLSESNPELNQLDVCDMAALEGYIRLKIREAGALFGYGGYGEKRDFYGRSPLFGLAESGDTGEPRRFHLGLDIWGSEGTEVFAPLDAAVHSLAFNSLPGDYGATILLSHQGPEGRFHTLYGHLSLGDLEPLKPGMRIEKGRLLGHFGGKLENGHWPPHLHFQIIRDLEGLKGDYPGVCRFSERFRYLENCPDPRFLTPFRSL